MPPRFERTRPRKIRRGGCCVAGCQQNPHRRKRLTRNQAPTNVLLRLKGRRAILGRSASPARVGQINPRDLSRTRRDRGTTYATRPPASARLCVTSDGGEQRAVSQQRSDRPSQRASHVQRA